MKSYDRWLWGGLPICDLNRFKGRLIGTSPGFDTIFPKFTYKLELKNVILEAAEGLYQDFRITEYDPWDNLRESKYAVMTY